MTNSVQSRSKNRTVLVVEDNHAMRKMIALALGRFGYTIKDCTNAADAMKLLAVEAEHIDVVVTDLAMENPESGIEVLRESKRLRPKTPVIVVTGSHSIESVVTALRDGVDDYVLKPVTPRTLEFHIERCLARSEQRERLDVYETILSACCVCHRIHHQERNEWVIPSEYILTKSRVSHGYCPDCMAGAARELREFIEAQERDKVQAVSGYANADVANQDATCDVDETVRDENNTDTVPDGGTRVEETRAGENINNEQPGKKGDGRDA